MDSQLTNLQNLEHRVENVVEKALGWRPLAVIGHVVFAALLAYVVYLMVVNRGDRSVTNLLLLALAVGVLVQIHQNINVQNGLLMLE